MIKEQKSRLDLYSGGKSANSLAKSNQSSNNSSDARDSFAFLAINGYPAKFLTVLTPAKLALQKILTTCLLE